MSPLYLDSGKHEINMKKTCSRNMQKICEKHAKSMRRKCKHARNMLQIRQRAENMLQTYKTCKKHEKNMLQTCTWGPMGPKGPGPGPGPFGPMGPQVRVWSMLFAVFLHVFCRLFACFWQVLDLEVGTVGRTANGPFFIIEENTT